MVLPFSARTAHLCRSLLIQLNASAAHHYTRKTLSTGINEAIVKTLIAQQQKRTVTLAANNQRTFKGSKNSTFAVRNSVPSFVCDKAAIASLFSEHASQTHDRALFIGDLGAVVRQYDRWQSELPAVHPFYAVKCNPDEVLLRELRQCGAGFDVASGEEMRQCIEMGVDPSIIIFANPIKNCCDLQYAASVGVKKMTFDNADELYKIKQLYPDAELVMRLLPDDSGSLMRFGVKFGTPHQHIVPLLQLAQRLKLKVIGTSFHIGSGCFDGMKYRSAIELCRKVFDIAEKQLGMPKFTFLDLGGGFPGNPIQSPPTTTVVENGISVSRTLPSFEDMAAVIRQAIHDYFPTDTNSHVQVIAEPGRYMATSFGTLFTYVQGKREEPSNEANSTTTLKKFLYYVNDGVYGSFNCIIFDHAHPVPIPAYRFMENKMMLQRQQQHYANAKSVATAEYALNGLMNNTLLQAEPQLAHASARHITSRAQRHGNSLATFFGPTCDSMDVIGKDVPMEELFVGDWVGFENMGAYTSAAASTFNGMQKAKVVYCKSINEAPVKA